MARRDSLLQAGDTITIETRQRNRETIPEFLLELLEHGFDRQNQNASAAAALDEF